MQLPNLRKDNNKMVIHRLKIAKGHLNKVISMVEEGKYCIDVVHQSIAVQAALKEVDAIILKNHLETCVAESIRKGNVKEVVDEMMSVIRKKTSL